MASINSVTLLGRVTKDPELRYTPNGVPVGHFSLAVDRPVGKDAEKKTDFIEVVCWRGTAEAVANHVTKGQQVAVQGRIQVRDYETQDGQKRRAVEVVAHNVQFLAKPQGNGRSEAPAEEEAPVEEEIPF